MLESKDYYIDQINSSKAYKFTAYWHYSGVGFKKAKVNLGVFRKSDNLLVGVLQWGVSAQEGIRLDRYVREPITKEQYLELNRFCMADSEGRNSESQAIALGIKWIKINRPDIKLLVSYAGRKEGNYGYIYQATNWEYLGYFISNGFWVIDGQERHQITLWNTYQRHGNQALGFTGALCELYDNVVQTWTKQFIYIQRLDRKLHTASPVLPYPKPSNEYPICTNIKIYKGDEYHHAEEAREPAVFYYEKDEMLFTRRTLIRQGVIVPDRIAIYNAEGQLEATAANKSEAARYCGIGNVTVGKCIEKDKVSGGWYFKLYPSNTEPAEEVSIPHVCRIDGIMFFSQVDAAQYCGVSKQAVSSAKKLKAKQIAGKDVEWWE